MRPPAATISPNGAFGGSVCNAPIASDSGVYALVDYCPTAVAPGKLGRRELASGAETIVSTCPAEQRLARIGASGAFFHYATLHATSGAAPGAPTWHLTVSDWTLARSHDVQPNPQPADPTTYGAPLDATVMPDGTHAVFTAVLDTIVQEPPSARIGGRSASEKPLHMMVAPLDGSSKTASVIWQPVVTHRGTTTLGAWTGQGTITYVRVPGRDAVIDVQQRSQETFSWTGGTC